ncbi:MAG: NADH-quinone oxidoreductase subunit NuoK [Dysgonamonadaceae bacterium]|nr:NADH-quinone oxidoreductase subunit NuoK [Dysgonamonadaceae bacterium]
MNIPMEHFLIVSGIMFFAGVYGFIVRKTMLAMLISLELMLNAVVINFCVFNRYLFPDGMEGMFFALFAIAIAAAETAIAIAIFINIHRLIHTIDVENVSEMKN